MKRGNVVGQLTATERDPASRTASGARTRPASPPALLLPMYTIQSMADHSAPSTAAEPPTGAHGADDSSYGLQHATDYQYNDPHMVLDLSFLSIFFGFLELCTAWTVVPRARPPPLTFRLKRRLGRRPAS